jgi:hypothetical protein
VKQILVGKRVIGKQQVEIRKGLREKKIGKHLVGLA